MGKNIQFVCDNPGCGAVRKSENHWWKVRTRGSVVSVMPFNPEEDIAVCEEIACGEPCALRMVSEHMGQVKTAQTDSQGDGAKV